MNEADEQPEHAAAGLTLEQREACCHISDHITDALTAALRDTNLSPAEFAHLAIRALAVSLATTIAVNRQLGIATPDLEAACGWARHAAEHLGPRLAEPLNRPQ